MEIKKRSFFRASELISIFLVYTQSMITQIIQQKLAEAQYKILENGTYFGEIVSCPGVWANTSSLSHCQSELQEVLEEWLLLHIARQETIVGISYASLQNQLPEYA